MNVSIQRKSLALVLMSIWLLAVAGLTSPAALAQTLDFEIEKVEDPASDLFQDDREIAPNGLPDGRVATAQGRGIVAAWYSEPTNRYRHGILGDTIEGGALKVRNELGEVATIRLSRLEVFEDITPRIADLDGDGANEVIAILSSTVGGGSFVVYGLNGQTLVKKGQTPFIGEPNRWLNIAGIAPFTGGQNPEIAVVVMPHLTGVLQFWRMQGADLVPVSRVGRGFSNHGIGSRELELSATANITGDARPELILPSLVRDELIVIGAGREMFEEKGRVKLASPIKTSIQVNSDDKGVSFTMGLENGEVIRVIPKAR